MLGRVITGLVLTLLSTPLLARGEPDAALEVQVGRAVERARPWLRARQRKDGSFAHPGHYRTFPTALCLLALLRADEEPGSGAVDRAFSWLRVQCDPDRRLSNDVNGRSTRSFSFAMQALEERRRRLSARRAPEADLVWMREMSRFLVASQSAHGWFEADPTLARRGWRSRIACTFLALRGLRAARCFGVVVEDEVFVRGLRYLLGAQRLHEPYAWTCCEGRHRAAPTALAIAGIRIASDELRDEKWEPLVARTDGAVRKGLAALVGTIVLTEHATGIEQFALEDVRRARNALEGPELPWIERHVRLLVENQGAGGQLRRGDWPAFDNGLALLVLTERIRPPEPASRSGARPWSGELNRGIRRAIRRGSAWLGRYRQVDGTIRSGDEHGATVYVTALCTIALLEGGVDPESRDIRKTLSWLESRLAVRNPKTEGDASIDDDAVMAQLLSEHRRRLGAKRLGQREGVWMKRMIGRLVAARNERGLWGAEKPAHRPRDRQSQISLHVLLAIREGRRCGISVDDEVFAGALREFVRTQDEGPRGPRPWTHRAAYGRGKDDRTLTSHGVAAVAVARGELEGRKWAALVEHADASVEDGLSWLGATFSVLCRPYELPWAYTSIRPGPHDHPSSVVCHGHLALGRACTLAGVARLGEHDWYRRTARHLLTTQLASGAWHADPAASVSADPRLTDQALHLLFLIEGLPALDKAKRESPPATTPRGRPPR
jgi:hypothetical protein